MSKPTLVMNPATGEIVGREYEINGETHFVATDQELWPGIRIGTFPCPGFGEGFEEWARGKEPLPRKEEAPSARIIGIAGRDEIELDSVRLLRNVSRGGDDWATAVAGDLKAALIPEVWEIRPFEERYLGEGYVGVGLKLREGSS